MCPRLTGRSLSDEAGFSARVGGAAYGPRTGTNYSSTWPEVSAPNRVQAINRGRVAKEYSLLLPGEEEQFARASHITGFADRGGLRFRAMAPWPSKRWWKNGN